jgi:hypothetical protein
MASKVSTGKEGSVSKKPLEMIVGSTSKLFDILCEETSAWEGEISTPVS